MSDEKIKTYSLKEIAEHSSKDSLWLLIENGVYDVTKFKDEHPGGEEPLIEQAGQDATDAFIDVGHSSDAKALMKDYKIGELCEEDRKDAAKANSSSSSFWIKLLVPLGFVLVAAYVYNTHYCK